MRKSSEKSQKKLTDESTKEGPHSVDLKNLQDDRFIKLIVDIAILYATVVECRQNGPKSCHLHAVVGRYKAGFNLIFNSIK